MTRKDIHDTARTTAEAVKDVGREALDAAKAGLTGAASDARSILRDEAERRADVGKDMAADQGQRLARTLRDAADARGEDSFQGRILDVVANGVADMSEGLRGRSLSSILEQTEEFARRNPGAFVAGAALAGFALARFARATAKPDSADEDGANRRGRENAAPEGPDNILATVQRRAKAEMTAAGADS